MRKKKKEELKWLERSQYKEEITSLERLLFQFLSHNCNFKLDFVLIRVASWQHEVF